MAYLALARKWRPRIFAEVVGQSHVVKALTNALDSGRVHHAFLFTGTRGVGKTTLARIFAKSLNCEEGVSAEPCQQCDTCLSIDEGRFVDLIEVDAASRTKVDDTRELLDNVQYAPSVGKYKVYLIDEVHMLSGHSFNALLKTLEEPPEHVKFLFATTDPQKLPVTVISRCLQFNLRALRPDQIENQLHKIVESEAVEYDSAALQAISKAADGSMRDGLSLLDQAIAQGANTVRVAEVQDMLGTIKAEHSADLITALVEKDAAKIMQLVAGMADEAIDFAMAVDELLMQLYYLSLAQVAPQSLEGILDSSDTDAAFIAQMATQFNPEAVQLFYQIALLGKRDIALAPSTRVGFEMTLLRMLAFEPDVGVANGQSDLGGNTAVSNVAPAKHVQAATDNAGATGFDQLRATLKQGAVSEKQPEPPIVEPEKVHEKIEPALPVRVVAESASPLSSETNSLQSNRPVNNNQESNSLAVSNVALHTATQTSEVETSEVQAPIVQEVKAKEPKINNQAASSAAYVLAGHNEWGELVEQSGLLGITKELAMNCTCERLLDDKIELSLSPKFKHLYKVERVEEMKVAMQQTMSQLNTMTLEFEESDKETPAECLQRLGFERIEHARQTIESEPGMKALVNEFDVKIVEDSIKPAEGSVKPF